MRQQNSCKDGYKTFLKVAKDRSTLSVLKLCFEKNYFEFANWLFVRIMPRELWLDYCLYGAELAYDHKSDCLWEDHGKEIMKYGISLCEMELTECEKNSL